MLQQAKTNLEEAIKNGIKGTNRECSYYPCHSHLQDCTFCYCPFYSCGDRMLGEFKISSKGKKVWSCMNCNWIHTSDVVKKVIEDLRKYNEIDEKVLREIFRRVRCD